MKRLTAIRQETDLRRRSKLLANKHPGIGTPLEAFFAECHDALALSKLKGRPVAAKLANEMLASIGQRLAENIQEGRWWNINKLSKAVRVWSDQRQRTAGSDRDKIRQTLSGMFEAFSPGWRERWVTEVKGGKIVRRGLPSSVREGIATRDIIANLPPLKKLEGESLRRTVQIVAQEEGYSLDDSPHIPPAMKLKKKLR